MKYYLISANLNKTNNKIFTLPNGVFLLPLSKPGSPLKMSHIKQLYNPIFSKKQGNSKMFNIQRFPNEHPAGLFTPGKPVQNVMFRFSPKNNKNTIVRGLIPLPLPIGANLGNSSKNINYQKVKNVNVNGIRLSNLVKNRPGVYIGMYGRNANANALNLEKGREKNN